jgi:hypothetical protein
LPFQLKEFVHWAGLYAGISNDNAGTWYFAVEITIGILKARRQPNAGVFCKILGHYYRYFSYQCRAA